MFNLYDGIINDFFNDIQENKQFEIAMGKRKHLFFHSVKSGVDMRRLWHHLFEE